MLALPSITQLHKHLNLPGLIGLIVLSLVVFAGINPIQAQTKILTAPANFTIDLINEDNVILIWEDASEGLATDFIIARSDTPGTAPKEIARVPSTESTYEDSSVVIGKTYTYRLQASAKGYLTGDTETKSVIVIKSAGESDAPTDAAGAQTVSTPMADGSDSQPNLLLSILSDPSRFWTNILAVNLVLIGSLILVYLLIRNQLEGPGGRAQKKLKISIDPKTGKRDVNIREQAFDRYFAERSANLKSWEKIAREE